MDIKEDNLQDNRTVCQIPELSLSCIGCCGFDFTSMADVIEALNKNTVEWKDFINPDDPTEMDLVGFRDRTPSGMLRLSGICYNLIWLDFNKGAIACPLHPKVSEYDGEDLRCGHCNPEYLCKTAFKFRRWGKDKQDRYLAFLKNKDIGWYDYSIKTDNNELLDEFNKTDLKSSNI